MGGQVALRCSHLMDSPCQELLQPHDRVWGEGGGVFVVRGCGVFGSPVLEEHVPGAGLEGLVGPSHEFRGGNVRFGWRGGM